VGLPVQDAYEEKAFKQGKGGAGSALSNLKGGRDMEESREVAVKAEAEVVDTDRLAKLGLQAASDKVGSARKMQLAYKNYLFVSAEKIASFNQKLREDTLKEDKRAYTFKRLNFIPLRQYQEVPPVHVLDALEKAQELGCFDTFEVAKIEWVEEVKDPILFGRIYGCGDYFFISQWDDDVKFEDILFHEKKG